jgi:RsiW-degrading membrane proteinase PrsW (M82 family)
MKYHYLTGVKKSPAEQYGRLVKWLLAALILIAIWDLAFNYCGIFIEIMVWTWE